MRCSGCNAAEMFSTTEPYKYTESGLPNVTLLGIEVRKCPECGEVEAVIPRIRELHKTIAMLLVRKETRLIGAEIRFLRTHLGYSSSDFAELIGVEREQVSRWENDKAPIGPQADRLLRMLVVHEQHVHDYATGTLSKISSEPAPAPTLRVKRAGKDWALEPQAA